MPHKKPVVSPTVQAAINQRVDEVLANAMKSPVLKDIEAVANPDPLPADEATLVEQVFQLFAVYCGDIKRTALAAGVPEKDVERLATAHGWTDKLKVLIDLRTSARPGDSERGINRAINFVQAHRMRNVLQSVIAKLHTLSPTELGNLCLAAEFDREGNLQGHKLSTRAFADLASALEKCHALTYAALNDSVSERKERAHETADQERSTSEIHLALTRAMADMKNETNSNATGTPKN